MKNSRGLFLPILMIPVFCIAQSPSPTTYSYGRVLQYTTHYLEQLHLSPPVIDDQFSIKLYQTYLQQLDPDTMVLTPADFASLQAFSTKLDDELHGQAPAAFIPTLYPIVNKRLEYLVAHFKDVPRWQQHLQQLQNMQYALLMEKAGKKPDKPDATLQATARQMVEKKTAARLQKLQKETTKDGLFNMYVNTITNLADPHSEYFIPAAMLAFENHWSGKAASSIGIQLAMIDEEIKISSLEDGGPASLSGKVEVGDVLAGVEQPGKGADISDMEPDELEGLLQGDKGTPVTITLRKTTGKMLTITLVRDDIAPEEQLARSAIIEQNGHRTGYLQLAAFYFPGDDPNGHSCSEDVLKELNKLKTAKIDGLIFDVRNNGGGSLPDVAKIIGYFIKSGPVVQVMGKNSNYRLFSDDDESIVWDGPMVVLVNGRSASAAELFTAAMQDYQRAVIAGTPSFGKGTVQEVYPIGRNAEEAAVNGHLKITVDKFYRINGFTTQNAGVTPDILIPSRDLMITQQEKKLPNALPADSLYAVDFTPWKNTYDRRGVIQKERMYVDQNQQFAAIKQLTTKLLQQQQTKAIDITPADYEQQRTANNQLNQQLSEALVPATGLTVKGSGNMTGEAAQRRYQQWQSSIGKDATLQCAVHIMNAMQLK